MFEIEASGLFRVEVGSGVGRLGFFHNQFDKQSSSFRLIFDAFCFAASRGGWSEIRVGFACMGSVAVVVIL